MVSRLVLNLRSVRATDDATAYQEPPSYYNNRSLTGKFSEFPKFSHTQSRVDQWMGALGQESIDNGFDTPNTPLPLTVITETYTYQTRWPEAEHIDPLASPTKSSRERARGAEF